MSNYKDTFRHRSTLEVHEIDCLDNFYGKHKYGYRLPDGTIITENALKNQYVTDDKLG